MHIKEKHGVFDPYTLKSVEEAMQFYKNKEEENRQDWIEAGREPSEIPDIDPPFSTLRE